MKYPEVLGIDQVLAQLHTFDAIIDARSPVEFAQDHLPGAINAPVLDDEERIRIGTMYKQVSAFDAKKVGAALVARNIAKHIEELWIDKPREWRPLVYCWRGGNRSGAMAHILAKIGWPVVQLEGGYKAFRQEVNTALEQPPALNFKVVCGTTGSGKSRLLETLHAQGAQVLDLEQLAAHRGSVLGHLPSQPQPSQKAFESHIWDVLRRFDPARPVFVEAESKKVGNLRVPAALMDAMRAADCIALTLSRADRVRLLMQDYQHFLGDPALLNGQLEHLTQLHGREKIARWHAMSDAGQMAPLVEELLADHYDPAYLRSIDRNFTRYGQAVPLALDEIDSAAFNAAALQLIATTR
ncbi:tRNA 2-selenouridine(34) synthase MnmH [Pseudoduganella sp. FT25W]|uniref:tRNA 2-selenouridine(34) synthase MnmH n=1 Tax=Duganella alba TaxID=2666081 RepID=A0A6L5Q914_9BURK|nr:tRNA 2-selenouridine(34) synthase MnmH [Duganella alba]MRX06304.1 tRNA 2-selenouridine(34) synthase MnmH [Duganella alba]MRX14698.1 tRNA 2-selenouridine(34) synthase MnmH [Duganella alba]